MRPPTGYDGFSSLHVERDASVIKPENIVSGVTILGVTGTKHNPTILTKTLSSESPNIDTPSYPNDCYSQVQYVVDSSVIRPENIKQGISILGISGNYKCANAGSAEYTELITTNEHGDEFVHGLKFSLAGMGVPDLAFS